MAGVRDVNVEELVNVAASDYDNEEYQQVRFAEGVLFLNRLLVSTDTVKVLSQFTEQNTMRGWLRKGN